jgi:hypothetical protein
MQTIDSISAIDDEQHYTLPAGEEDDEYLYSPACIRRQIARNVRIAERLSGLLETIESSDEDSDFVDTADSDHGYESDTEQSSSKGSSTVGVTPYDAHELPTSEVTAKENTLSRKMDYAIVDPTLTPTLDKYRRQGSHLSLASVLSGRDDFALSKVEDLFTDADGKYFKQFASELPKIGPKTSKDELCIEEFIFRSEKEWSSGIRNKKLGIDASFGSDMKGYFSKQVPLASGDGSHNRRMTRPLPEPTIGYIHPTGMRLFLQRRVGDWPLYSFPLALVLHVPTAKARVKLSPLVPSSSLSSLIRPRKARRSYMFSLRSTWQRRLDGGLYSADYPQSIVCPCPSTSMPWPSFLSVSHQSRRSHTRGGGSIIQVRVSTQLHLQVDPCSFLSTLRMKVYST